MCHHGERRRHARVVGTWLAITGEMLIRVACALGLVCGCGHEAAAIEDASTADPDDANTVDAVPDAHDGSPSDTTAPALAAIEPPGGDVWLHEPIRFVFDEPVALTGATIDAKLAGVSVAATLALDGDRAISVTIDPAARGIGALDLELGAVADLAGNVAVPSIAHHTVAAWSRPAVDRGLAASSPALAITDTGSVLAAWIAGGQLVVSRHEHGVWQALGSALGTATSPSIALDDGDRPVVAWTNAGSTRIARWNGAGWIDLPSLGAGSAIAVAANPGGGSITALVIGGSAQVYALANDVWQPLGGSLALGGTLVGAPALAVPTTGAAAVGWIAGNTLHVYRYATSWVAMAPIALGTPPAGFDRMSLAARGPTLAVAWDQWGGSFGVFAAIASGTAWTRLGRALDVDVAGDASAPAIALDASGAPIVAWRERIETAERGVIARWSGAAWTIVGGDTWLASASAPTPPTLALHAGEAPVVGWSADGVAGIARFNGPRVAGFGIASRASIAGCTFSANPPIRLSQTGCFTLAIPGKPTPHPGLVPYDIVVELWSDGAKKRRWIALPDGASMIASSTGAWVAPVGTVIIKEFALETTPGDPASRRAMETRFLVHDAAGWRGFSYQWRLDGSDADLLNDGQYTFDWPLDGGGTHTHVYPSQSQCLSCHESSYGPLLGIRPQQLARWNDYNGVIADQIPTLAHLGIGPGTTATPFIAPHDPSATWEQRMRGYMAANCAHCHNPDHIAIKDLRYPTPLAQTRLCEVIVPGSPTQSIVYQKVTSRPGMPPLGTLAVDPLATELLGNWITGMTSCP
jgi:hypothetical protein